jgi:hypothetical protein
LAQGPMGKVLVGIPSYAQQLAHSG